MDSNNFKFKLLLSIFHNKFNENPRAKKMQLTIFLGFIGSIAHAINPNQEYIDFLQRYEQLANAYDLEGLDMYDDEARIVSHSTSLDGTQHTSTMQGQRLKELAKENLEQLKKVGIKTTYSNIKVERNNNTIKISADKYNDWKCFTDKDYYMTVSRKTDKKLYIIEESTHSPIQSLCKDELKDSLALQLSLGASMMNKNLPMLIDPYTSYESIEAKDKTLIMTYRLVHFPVNEINIEGFEQAVLPEIINHNCKEQGSRTLLDKDAIFRLQYIDQNKRPVTEVDITKHNCHD